MDPATAIGVASSAITFAEFSRKILQRAYQIYSSSEGRTKEEARVLVDLGDFDRLAQNAQQCLRRFGRNSNDGEVASILHEVKLTARDFEEVIRKLVARQNPGRRVLGSLKAAAVSLYGKSVVSELQERLNDIQNRTLRFVLFAIWDESKRSAQREMHFAKTLDEITSTLSRIRFENTTRYGIFEEGQVEPDTKLPEWSDSQQGSDPIRTQLINALSRHDAIYNEVVQRLFRPRNKLGGHYPAVLPEYEPNFQQSIINSLVDGVFHEIKDREEAIPKPYTDTYSWVFERTPDEHCGLPLWSSFPEWLEGKTECPFWITGKPGSGKSTLMKYILHDARLRGHLKVWAGRFPLQITSFFAWIAGSDLQSSTRGLIRTVLCQCLQSSRDLTAVVAPRRWALCSTLSNCNRLPPWEDWELHESFNNLLLHIVKYKRVAIFIDGLDEFKIMPTEILAVIQELCRRDGFKVCVASRQWVEFSDKLDGYPMLRMQDLTRDDTRLFVEGSLNNNRGFNELRQIFGAEVKSLVLEVVNKSNGVFLWAHLVTRNLLQAFSEGDGLPKLRQTLQSLPGDLDRLYLKIWEQAGDRQSEFAQFVALKRAAEGNLYFLNFWLTDPDNSEGVDMRNLATPLLNAIRSQVVRRLDKCTRGILELSRSDNIEYLHRTTLDWLAKDDVWAKVRLFISPDFDACLSLLQSEAMMCRMPWDRMDLSDQRVYEVLRYAHRIENNKTTRKRLTKILDDFNKEMAERHKFTTCWTSRYKCSFFDLACRYCATPYLETYIIQEEHNTRLQDPVPDTEPEGESITVKSINSTSADMSLALDNVVLGHMHTSLSSIVPLQVRRDTAKLLLRRGFNVNQALKEKINFFIGNLSIDETGVHHWPDQPNNEWVVHEWTKERQAERDYLTEMANLSDDRDREAPEPPTLPGRSTPTQVPMAPATPISHPMPLTERTSRAARLKALIGRR